MNRTITLEGMHCADCAVKLERSVSRLEGVNQVSVNFATAKMSLAYTEPIVNFEIIKKQINNLGYGIQQQSSENRVSVFRIDGMDCADCAQKLEKRVGSLTAVNQVTVNYGAAKMTVDHNGTADQSILQTVKQAGYTATLDTGNITRSTAEASFWRRNNKVLPTFLSGLLFALAWVLTVGDLVNQVFSTILYAAAIVVGGFRIARTGFYGLKSRIIGMDLLMTVAAVGAALIGQWEEGAAVVFLFSLGETLEAYTMDRTRKSIRGLMEFSPKEALVRRDGRESMIAIEDIQIGDTVIIKPGEKIAMDGVILKGHSTINQAPITGESIPVEKSRGDEVFAGTINQQGALEVEVTKLSKDNTLSRIISMVEDAQAQKAPSQRFVDVFSKYYTPAVLIIAVGLAIIPPVFFGQPFQMWIYRSLMMLVVSCPCALVISTPVSIVSAIGNAARNGILIKGGAHLERLGAVSVVAFDKTGTLTAGMPQVTVVIALDGRKEEEVLSIAAGIESSSEHPVAEAIVRFAEQKGIRLKEISSFSSVTGQGVKATIQGEEYFIGSPKWFIHDLNVSLEEIKAKIQELEQQAQTVMVMGTSEQVIAIFAVADEVRANSKSTLEQLKRIGIKKTVMLTGDNRGTAQAVAAKLGDIEYYAELLPQDKVASMKKLMAEYGHVAMIGDGVNDAPALATATVGIAMGAAGTDTALETADVALMADDLSKLPYAISLSRRALKIIKQNIAFSLLVKVVFLVMIFMGTSTLWMAVLADTGSSLIVIANGMRLLRKKSD
ncbi:heavy metal translocating P-type ATPase [Paenibacillus chondroitinus]|uniref:Copper-exporting P-type ATPase n=1 Tax=Paenibacillus chondroitinus TaxID=59842 RepID=A0ABU6DDL0_9BACL|nr:heavy metal translocating P-type ATPase [Paenibacillus chondroitinus]MCY9662378.1 cadmium-translocating P-type ATPase [Paenibacillus anseongense]MEB4795829.1 heavy metal translocating P-type ATPase [Paenibacillus chondroitinus]